MPMELHGLDVAAGSLCRTAASSKLAAVFVQNLRAAARVLARRATPCCDARSLRTVLLARRTTIGRATRGATHVEMPLSPFAVDRGAGDPRNGRRMAPMT